ncbi:hypothetical protein AA313_de0209522 [Arthrobotrys entomopaga]|nr:hypothetical protein AA313_de0209522 [Arthrobotrys entomopaga]
MATYHTNDSPAAASTPLAIVGFSFKFPAGIEDSDSFWETILNGEVSLRDIPEGRFNLQNFRNTSTRSSGNKDTKGYFIQDDISAFDAPFFSITAEEAIAMDPQQRLLLETTYHAIENAGIKLGSIRGSKTSVHIGCLSQDYRAACAKDPENSAKYTVTGTEHSMLSNRLSWFFDLRGPSMSVETACSSSLVALDLGCQLLRSGETNMAIVGGTNLIHMPDFYMYLDNMGFLSPDGKCQSFDSRANGYARAEGLGVLVIKRLSDAIRDNNTIRAVIRATGTNSDGYTPGITQPNGLSQFNLIRDTYQKAGISMEDTRYCEAHGTGTAIGDPIEAHAIGRAFRATRSSNDPLYIGTAKANIGHMEAASGIAGIVKTILILERGIMPPIAGLTNLNPAIDGEFYKLKFPKKAVFWPNEGPRRASVNSFGFGGTNAHLIMDDAYSYLNSIGAQGIHNTRNLKQIKDENPLVISAKIDNSTASEGWSDLRSDITSQLIILSAADREGLKRVRTAYAQYLTRLEHKSVEEASQTCRRLASTLGKNRTMLSWRSYTIINSLETLRSLGAELSPPKRPPTEPRLLFVFTGQGAQWARMGIELMQYPIFAQSIKRSAKHLTRLGCDWDLEEELKKPGSTSRIHDPDISQPLSSALQIAFVDLLERINLKPSIVVGHSSGEIAAAYCKGAISHEGAMKIAYYRGMGGSVASKDPTRNATMMAIGLGEKESLQIIATLSTRGCKDLHIACINSPCSVTIAGDVDEIDLMKTELDQKGIFARKLKVPCAYHSPHMMMMKDYVSRVKSLKPRCGASESKSITMLSYVTGEEVSSERLRELDYWIVNSYSAVRFTDCISAIDECGSLTSHRKKLGAHKQGLTITNTLEIGPHSALKGPLRDILKTFKHVKDIHYDNVMLRGQSAIEPFLRAVGSLRCSGFDADISYLNKSSPNKHDTTVPLVDLPAYPFNHSQTYWSENDRSKSLRFRHSKPLELLGSPTLDSQPFFATWRNFIGRQTSPWIDEYQIQNSAVYPNAGVITMAIEAMNLYARDNLNMVPAAFSLKNVKLMASIPISESATRAEVQTVLQIHEAESFNNINTWFKFNVLSHQEGIWEKICEGLIHPELDDNHSHFPWDHNDSAVIESPRDEFYSELRKAGYSLGSSFRKVNNLEFRGGEIRASIDVYSESTQHLHNHRALDFSHIIHPTTLDSLLQLPLASTLRQNSSFTTTMVPTGFKRMWISSTGLNCNSPPLSASSWLQLEGQNGTRHSLRVANEKEAIKLEIEGYELSAVNKGFVNTAQTMPEESLHVCWRLGWEKFTAPPPKNSSSPNGDTPATNGVAYVNGKTNGTAIPLPNIEIHVHEPTSAIEELAKNIKDLLEIQCPANCEIVASILMPEAVSETDIKIILWDVDRESILVNPKTEVLSMIQSVLKSRKNIIWLQTADVQSQAYSSQHIIDGLSRVVQQEQNMGSFALLSLLSTTISTRATAIFKLTEQILSNDNRSEMPQTFRETTTGDFEFCQLKENANLTQIVRSAQRGTLLEPVPTLWEHNAPLRITINPPGNIENLHFVEDKTPKTPLQDDEVEVEVKAAGISFRDYQIASGTLNESSIGGEFAGIVSRVGRKVDGLVPGDRVCGLSVEGIRTFVRSKGCLFSKFPDSLSFLEAASIPMDFLSAWHSLKKVAHLSADDKILIVSGVEEICQAAIQVAKSSGAKIIVTVNSLEEAEMLSTRYSIPEDHILQLKDGGACKKLEQLTSCGGVDVVFSATPSEKSYTALLSHLAPFGRLIQVGGSLPLSSLSEADKKNWSFSLINMNRILSRKPEIVASLLSEVLEKFRCEHLKTAHKICVFCVSKSMEAFKVAGMQDHAAKVVLDMKPGSQVPAIITSKCRTNFSPDATYVIAGGLGGLGRDIARWMAERGAKHIVLLSRSGARTEQAKCLRTELKSQGVNCLTPSCDISSYESLRETIEIVAKLMPPVRGCIQATMVLRSNVFSNMSHAEWIESTSPKVSGSWNLHLLLPGLDFFVLLSSVQGIIGSRTQSNYAAANTYMDALALHRVSTGSKAISIQLGLMDTDGYLAEHVEEKKMLLAQNSYIPIRRAEFRALLDFYCDPNLPLLRPEEAQVALGLRILHTDPNMDDFGASWGKSLMFKELRRLTEITNQNELATKDITAQFAARRSDTEAYDVVITALTERFASAISGVDPGEIDLSKSVQAYGVDSLQTLELKSWFFRIFSSNIEAFEIVEASNLKALASLVTERSSLRARE